MSRWSTLEGSIYHFTQPKEDKPLLENFFKNRAFIPKTDKEKEEYEDFSFVSSAMALLVYIAQADGQISDEEKKTIMNELKFQLEHRHFEYKVLEEEISRKEMEILNDLFARFRKEIEEDICDLDKIIRIINMIYQKNQPKRNYLVRISFFVAYADKVVNSEEREAIKEIAEKLDIPPEEQLRIENEVRTELEIE